MRKFKIIIDIKFFLKINKIEIVKIKSNIIGRASKLIEINVKKNKKIYIIIFFI